MLIYLLSKDKQKIRSNALKCSQTKTDAKNCANENKCCSNCIYPGEGSSGVKQHASNKVGVGVGLALGLALGLGLVHEYNRVAQILKFRESLVDSRNPVRDFQGMLRTGQATSA